MFLYCTGVVLLAWYRNNNSIVTALQGLALARAEDTKYGRRLRVRASGNRLAYNNLEDKSECHVSHQRKKTRRVRAINSNTANIDHPNQHVETTQRHHSQHLQQLQH